MKRLILSLAAVGALATAMPAAAQGFGGWGHRFSDDRIEFRINQGIRDGSLTRREARTLRRQLMDARALEARYMRDGRVNVYEARELDRRYAALNRRLRWERNDGQNRNVGTYPYYR